MTNIIRKVATKFNNSLSGNDLKIIAVVAMTLDHIAEGFLPEQFWGYQVLRFIGRITGPTMMFLIAEGYKHTHDVRRYLARLAVFSLISWIPFALFEDGSWPALDFSVQCFSFFFMGLCFRICCLNSRRLIFCGFVGLSGKRISDIDKPINFAVGIGEGQNAGISIVLDTINLYHAVICKIA